MLRISLGRPGVIMGKKIVTKLLTHFFLIVLVVIFFVPFYWMLISSF